MPSYTNITGSGLTGTFYALALDPFSDWLGAPQSGNLGAWCLTSTGLYYTPNILATSPLWTQKSSFSASSGILRPSTTARGVVYVARILDGGGFSNHVQANRFSNYGATADWYNSLGDGHDGDLYGFDIDHNGYDECLIGVRIASNIAVWRITNGTPAELTGTSLAGGNVSFIQKPLKTFTGLTNNGIAGTEVFIYAQTYPAPTLYKTTDGGATVTAITPPGMSTVPMTVSSICAVDDPNYMALIDASGQLFTSTNGGASWTNRGTDSAGMSGTIGQFPRLMNGLRGLYMAGNTKLMFSPDFGATLIDKTGSYVSDIGTPTAFMALLPLY